MSVTAWRAVPLLEVPADLLVEETTVYQLIASRAERSQLLCVADAESLDRLVAAWRAAMRGWHVEVRPVKVRRLRREVEWIPPDDGCRAAVRLTCREGGGLL